MADQNEYIIENDNWDNQEPRETVKMTNADLPEGLEIIEDDTPQEKIQKEIQELAKQEGLEGTDMIGGQGASPEEVIAAMRAEQMPEGARKNKIEYEDKKIEEFKELTATREMLFGRLNKPVKLYVNYGTDPETGEPQKLVFLARRLSETENNHLINYKLIGKQLSELNRSEYEDSMAFRRRTLASTIVEPKLTEQEWANDVDNAMVTAIFEEVQKMLEDVSDSDMFQ